LAPHYAPPTFTPALPSGREVGCHPIFTHPNFGSELPPVDPLLGIHFFAAGQGISLANPLPRCFRGPSSSSSRLKFTVTFRTSVGLDRLFPYTLRASALQYFLRIFREDIDNAPSHPPKGPPYDTGPLYDCRLPPLKLRESTIFFPKSAGIPLHLSHTSRRPRTFLFG